MTDCVPWMRGREESGERWGFGLGAPWKAVPVPELTHHSAEPQDDVL